LKLLGALLGLRLLGVELGFREGVPVGLLGTAEGGTVQAGTKDTLFGRLPVDRHWAKQNLTPDGAFSPFGWIAMSNGVPLVPPIYKYVSLVILHRESGTIPESQLYESSRVNKLPSEDTSDGMDPFSEFFCKDSQVNFPSVERLVGIVPVKEFSERYSVERELSPLS